MQHLKARNAVQKTAEPRSTIFLQPPDSHCNAAESIFTRNRSYRVAPSVKHRAKSEPKSSANNATLPQLTQ